MSTESETFDVCKYMQGDSGGPLTVEMDGKHTLAGVVNFGPGERDVASCGEVWRDADGRCLLQDVCSQGSRGVRSLDTPSADTRS